VNSSAAIFRFGNFELRSRTREFYKHGRKLRLRPQPFEVLLILLEHAGDVVTREELHQRLWPSDTFVDFEHGLNTSVKELRAVLGDSVFEPRYIQTLPRLGYRVIVPVIVEASAVSTQDIAEAPADTLESLATEKISDSRTLQLLALRRWRVILGILVVLIVALGGFVQWSRSRARSHPANQRLMLAVLPFKNLTGDTAQDYFSDGLTEEMIAQLGRVEPDHLGVIARTSVMHYKNSEEQLQRIAHELEVQYVLEGSVRRDSNKVRITAQLIQMRDQTPVWAQQYDRDVSNLLTLQGEIAQQIANEIQVILGDHHKLIGAAREPLLSPNEYEAYDLYLKGRYFWNKRTPEGFDRAVECFERAIEKDPSYAPAYAGLADSYALMSGYSVVLPKAVMPKARAAAQRAIALDDKLAEAHASLAVIAQNYDWDWATAEKEYRRAIELDPNYATGHHWYAEHLALEGRFDQAFAEMQRARQLDPLSLIMATDNGAILYFSRQYDRAIEQFRSVLDMESNFPRAHMLVFAYVEKGLYGDALADIDKWQRVDENPWNRILRVYVHGRSGERVLARQELKKLEETNHLPIDPLTVAVACIGMNDKEQAFIWLQKSYLEHSGSLTALKVDPTYDPLRSDPRFQELLRRIGLAE
jgi:TolB-like protein/DNA-binding winged helix-turn-helix (wHTH) protein/Tfp pilus assembly protein PilF